MSKENAQGAVPKLRFPEFRDSEEWTGNIFGEMISLEYGSPLSEKDRIEGTIPVVGSNGIIGFHNKALIEGPAIVIGRKGSAGKVNWINSSCFPIDTTFFVISKRPQDFHLSFLYLLLEGSDLEQLKDNGAVPGINRAQVYAFKTFLPKPAEQQKIAACLSSLDETIGAEREKLEALKAHKRGLMQGLFPAEGETVPRLRFREFEGSGEWIEALLGSRCSNIASGKDKHNQGGNYDLYGSTGIIGRTHASSHQGDFILVARVGANAGFLNRAKGQFGVTDNTLTISLNDSESIDFVYYSLERFGLNKLIFGSGQPLITGGQLKSLNISWPKPDEQQKIASTLSSLDELITAQSQKIETLKTHKRGLMQVLFPLSEL